MKQVTQNYKTGKLKVEEVPMPVAGEGQILVENKASFISAGTEKMIIELARKSIAGKARERPDLVKKVLEKIKNEGLIRTYKKVMSRLDESIALGYSSAGRVREVGEKVRGIKPGDRVGCAGMGYASHAEFVSVPKNLCVKIPDDVSFRAASSVTVGSIAMQGFRQADARLGETVVVIGLGLIGQITSMIAKAGGCNVVGVDVDPERVEEAKKLGIERSVVRDKDVKSAVQTVSGGVGADSVIITAATDSNDPVVLAGDIARDRATVTAVGDVNLDIPRKVYYEKELNLNLSRSYGPGRYDRDYEEKGLDYPVSYVRWTENRNMKSYLRLLAEEKIGMEDIITHRYSIDEAEKAYEMIMGDEETFTGVVLRYEKGDESKRITLKDRKIDKSAEIKVGFIGAGNFATGVLLPEMKSLGGFEAVGLANRGETKAKDAASKFDYSYAVSDYKELLDDENINTVVVATRHNTHAQIVSEALDKGKHVFVEKPLAMDERELEDVSEAYENGSGCLMVGFNRRFAATTGFIKDKFCGVQKPLTVNYRINAGTVPEDHWIQDPETGGGRIIGEVCHFIDLTGFIVDSEPRRIYALSVSGGEDVVEEDNVSISIEFKDGSLGNILYTAGGDTSAGKERVEVFGSGCYGLIDGFKRAQFLKDGKKEKKGGFLSGQDKGHRSELSAFFDAIREGGSSPILFRDSYLTTLATFRAMESLRSGEPERIEK